MTTLFFTATGNSLYVARRIGGKQVSIPQAIKSGQYEFSDDIIGIVCPVYANRLPSIVSDFLEKRRLTQSINFWF